MSQDIRSVALFSGWAVDDPGEQALLGRMEAMLTALTDNLHALRGLDVEPFAPSGLGGVRRDASRL